MRISNWLIHGWSGRGGAGRWKGLDYATTNGSGSRTFCLGVKDKWAAPLKIIDCSSKRFSTALGPGVRGGIYLSVLAIGNRSINVSADGRRAGFSTVFSSCRPAIADSGDFGQGLRFFADSDSDRSRSAFR